MIGAFASLAASREATTVDEEVTLMAGMAKLSFFRQTRSSREQLLTPFLGRI